MSEVEQTATAEQAKGKPTLRYWVAAVPALLILSICIALALAVRDHHKPEETKLIAGEITVDEMVDYLNKLTRWIGPRDLTTEEGQKALRSTVAMAEGTLGPSNIGYATSQVTDSAQGFLWRTVWLDAGPEEAKNVVVVQAPYGGTGEEVAFALGYAEFLTKKTLSYKVRLVFTPPLAGAGELSWVEKRVMSDEETLVGLVQLQAGEAAPELGELVVSAELKEKLGEVLEKRRWEALVPLREKGTGGEKMVGFVLARDAQGRTQETAADFIRLIAVMEEVVRVLVER